mgnify:CR=1 FL=1
MKKLREHWKKHLCNKKGATLVETMVSLLLITVLLAMAAGALSSAFRIFLRIQKTQYAQSVLDTAMTELRTQTKDAMVYVKIYDSGNEVADQAGTNSGAALEFMNKEGYVVLLTTDGCEQTSLYITDKLTGTAEQVGSGELLARYYFPQGGITAGYTYAKGQTPVARAVAAVFGKGFYMGNYLEVTYSFPDGVADGATVDGITATLKLYADEAHTKELASDTELLSFRHRVARKDAVTAKTVSK